MLNGDPIKIPELPKKINLKEKDGIIYVRYLAERNYDPEKKYNVPEWVMIGKQVDGMPGLMIPNDNYEQIFCKEGEETEEKMTAEEEQYTREYETYGMYSSFFTGLYNEFRQQARRNGDDPINRYKAESINRVLEPLRELMSGEEYAGMLGMIEIEGEGEEGMTYGDVIILLTQYKTALAKYHRSRL